MTAPYFVPKNKKKCRGNADDEEELRGLPKITRPKHEWNSIGVIIDRGDREFVPLQKASYQQRRLDNLINLNDERPIVKTTTLTKNNMKDEYNVQTSGRIKRTILHDGNIKEKHL